MAETTTRLKLPFPDEKDNASEGATKIGELAQLLDEITVASVKPSIIATEQSRENTAYGTLATPDEVTVVLPENGLIAVAFQALWARSAGTDPISAAIFIGTNQLRIREQGIEASPVAVEAEPATGGSANFFSGLFSCANGLQSLSNEATNATADVTTGQLVGGRTGSALFDAIGGPCYIFAAAGTYKISIQYKATTGKVIVKGRKLWAWVVA